MGTSKTPFSAGPRAKILGTIITIFFAIVVGFGRLIDDFNLWWLLIPIFVLAWALDHYFKKEKSTFQKKEQEERELTIAKYWIGRLKQKNIPPFYLYLRPFDTTNAILIPDTDPASENYYLAESLQAQMESLEVYLGKATAPIELIALGNSGESIGAARVEVSDDQWKALIIALAQKARGIFCLPASREGTTWEVQMLFKKPSLLKKTVFLMPPKLYPIQRWQARNKFPIRKEWESLRMTAGKYGWQMPEYRKRGMFFTLDPNGAIRKQAQIKNWSIIKDIRAVLQELHAGAVSENHS